MGSSFVDCFVVPYLLLLLLLLLLAAAALFCLVGFPRIEYAGFFPALDSRASRSRMLGGWILKKEEGLVSMHWLGFSLGSAWLNRAGGKAATPARYLIQ